MADKLEISKSRKPSRATAPGEMGATLPLMTLRNQMDRLFDDFMSDWRLPSLSRDLFGMPAFQTPGESLVDVRFDISEGEEGIEITAELPGMAEKDVEIALDNGVLTIKGEKKFEKETKDRDYHLSERRYGHFARSMRLPDSIDQEHIRANFDKGVLSVILPKRPEAKAQKKKIEISKG